MSQSVDLRKGLSASDLRSVFIKRRIPRSEEYRASYGRSLDMARIQSAIDAAGFGLMTELCDIETETMAVDPHLSSVLSKRFGAVATADWDVTASQGWTGSEKEDAEEIATETRDALEAIPYFGERLYDLAWANFDGRAALEIHWDFSPARRTRWMPSALEWVHPRRLAFDQARRVQLIDTAYQRGSFVQQGVVLEDVPGKFVAWTPRLFRELPEREGLGPRCLYWSFFKRFSWRMRMTLTELFAVPWRILTHDGSAGVTPDMESAKQAAEDLGATTTAAFGKGIKADVVFPGENSGALFQMSSTEVNSEMSKLVLGNTGTTDPDANRANSIIQKGEQDILFQRDGNGVSGRIQAQLVRTFVALNYGEAALPYAGKFQLRTQPQRDRAAELERVKTVLSFGVHVAESEVREISGLRQPEEDEPFIEMGSPGTDPLGNPLPPTARVVDPAARKVVEEVSTPAVGLLPEATAKPTVTITPSDVASIISVNEGRASTGLGPLLLPDGTPDPDGYISITEYKAKHAAVVAQAAAATAGSETPTPAPVAVAPETAVPVAPDPVPVPDVDDLEVAGPDGAAENAEADLERAADDPVLAQEVDVDTSEVTGAGGPAPLPLPEAKAPRAEPDGAEPHGSPEAIAKRAREEAEPIFAAWGDAIRASLESAGDGDGAMRGLDAALQRMPLDGFVEVIVRASLHAAMLGALDSDWEMREGEPVEPETFEREGDALLLAPPPPADGGPGASPALPVVGPSQAKGFANLPFERAIEIFKGRRVISKAAYEKLEAAERQRAFTVAKLATEAEVQRVKDALAKSLEKGEDLRAFKDNVGPLIASPPHAENVFRTGVMASYGNGRREQMTDPAVIKARPFWQIMGVDDARTRPNHRAAHRKVVRADDPFWQRANPPFGFQCRCRVVSRSQRDLERLGLEVIEGSRLQLPDEGFETGGLPEPSAGAPPMPPAKPPVPPSSTGPF